MRPGIHEPRSGARPSAPREALARDEVHLWRASLDPAPAVAQKLRQTLTREEEARIRRLRRDRDRRRAAVSRGLLRGLLARYAGVEPGRLRFHVDPEGKPSLAGLAEGIGIHFSLSHSGELLLLAVARGGPVGVDLEQLRPIRNVEGLARRCLSARERAAFDGVPESLKVPTFLSCWTRKEAYAKAVGDGLRGRPARIEVSLAPGRTARLLAVDGVETEPSEWCLHHLEPEPGFVGALATRGPVWRISTRRLEAGDVPWP